MGNPSTELTKLLLNKTKAELLQMQSEIRNQPGVTTSKLEFLVLIDSAIKNAK